LISFSSLNHLREHKKFGAALTPNTPPPVTAGLVESSHSVKNVTRFESPSFPTWLVSSLSHQKSWLKSRYHWHRDSQKGVSRDSITAIWWQTEYFL